MGLYYVIYGTMFLNCLVTYLAVTGDGSYAENEG